jgi:hypothetical protein
MPPDVATPRNPLALTTLTMTLLLPPREQGREGSILENGESRITPQLNYNNNYNYYTTTLLHYYTTTHLVCNKHYCAVEDTQRPPPSHRRAGLDHTFSSTNVCRRSGLFSEKGRNREPVNIGKDKR